MGLNVSDLPEFPWDTIESYRGLAASHEGGLIDLSVGTPVDSTPVAVRQALAEHSDWPGYPATIGTRELRDAIVRYYERHREVHGLRPEHILPSIGSKEMVALLPSLLGLSSDDAVVIPSRAYPTYEIGAVLAGAQALVTDNPAGLEPADADRVKLVWLNSPSNPTGEVLSVDDLRRVVDWATERNIVVASDECYAELAWEQPWTDEGIPSILDRRVCGGKFSGLLALYSLSKRSNLAGYRAAWIAGDSEIIARLAHVRKHMGMIVPGPIQEAMVAALDEDAAVRSQRLTYHRRRVLLLKAITEAGMVVDGSDAGLYLWVRSEPRGACWDLVQRFARLGILVAPGAFYGEAAADHVRVALTATDAEIQDAVVRLSQQ